VALTIRQLPPGRSWLVVIASAAVRRVLELTGADQVPLVYPCPHELADVPPPSLPCASHSDDARRFVCRTGEFADPPEPTLQPGKLASAYSLATWHEPGRACVA
jgi:hypothetical protein